MAVFTGREAAEAGSGTVSFDNGTFYNQVDVTISRTVEEHTYRLAGKTETQRAKGFGDATGTIRTLHDTSNPPVDAGTTGTLTFTAYTGRVYTLKIMVLSYDVNFVADGLCEVTYRFGLAGTGDSTDYSVV